MTTTVVKVTVSDVNDNHPAFDRLTTQVVLIAPALADQSQTSWIEVAVVKATDADSGLCGHVIYVIIAGNERGLFVVDQNTGYRI